MNPSTPEPPPLAAAAFVGIDWADQKLCRATLFRGNGAGSVADYSVGIGEWGTA
jgi:hypothetical protein